MDIVTESFRWGLEHIGDDNPHWVELQTVLRSVTRDDVLAAKRADVMEWRHAVKKSNGRWTHGSPAVGGQKILNRLIDARLASLGWRRQISVLEASLVEELSADGTTKKRKKAGAYWTMDFKKDDIGVEVSFNNAGVLSQNILRLSVLSENSGRPRSECIRVGVLVTATNAMKKWSHMDSTVLTFETVSRVMPHINFNIPTPLVLVGVNSSEDGEAWADTQGFFGHKKLKPYQSLTAAEQTKWCAVFDLA